MNTKKNIKLVLVHCTKTWHSTPHLGIVSLSSYIEEKCPYVTTKVIEDTNPLKEILRNKPDIVGFTADSVDYEDTKIIASKIKQKTKTFLIIGGVHITACPESFNKNFDIGVVGEGEVTLFELLEAFQKNKKIKNTDYKKIDGVIYFDKKTIIKTKTRALIKNIDELPIPKREFVPMEKKYLSNQINLYGVKRMISLMTSRGCPYHCVYCGSPVQWGSVRFHSVDYVIKEIDYLIKKYKIDGINFFDDLFIAPKQRLLLLVEKIKEKGWDKTIVFSGLARANLIDEEIIKALKSINLKRLSFGFENFSPKILNYLKVNSVSVKDNINAINLCHKYGIAVSSGFIVGTPGETIKDLQITYAGMKKYPIENPSIYILLAYPGTKIWNFALDKGLVSKDMNMNKLFIRIPFMAYFKFWKKDRFYFLKDSVFLNQEKRYDKKYLSMILKMNFLAILQNYKFYFKYLLTDPKIIIKILNR